MIGLVVAGNPPVVSSVVAGGAGETAGFRAGDGIESIDGKAVETAEQFTRAVVGWLAGLRALKQYDFVDSGKVFVFAHSMARWWDR
jgi:membrane-associated protease RseP (regulator of RpoE activity)